MKNATKIGGFLVFSLVANWSCAQQQPPFVPLGNPPVPSENPLTPAKINLGKALFWDEQLSSTGTVACGSCHRPNAAGTDPRTAAANGRSTHPGPDGVLLTPDDIRASQGVPQHDASGNYSWSAYFSLMEQVGTRKSPSVLNAAFASSLFWDGRASASFVDPVSGLTIIANGGALESQSLMPLLDAHEMSPLAANYNLVLTRLQAKPLALAQDIPISLQNWINNRSYAALFAEAFGDANITPARIAAALASYQRTLITNQAPVDTGANLTAEEARGAQLFAQLDCVACHAGPQFTDHSFKYIGVRPVNEDLARFNITNNPQDRGAFKVPGLRNVAARAPYMHNGRFQTLAQVVDFYARGGDFNAPNKDPRVRPRQVNPQDRQALVAFLTRPLTDVRVAQEVAPFDRPKLYGESDRVPQVYDVGRAGQGGLIPQAIALEPPLLGRVMSIGLSNARPSSQAYLVISRSDPGLGASLPVGDLGQISVSTNSSPTGIGYASAQVALSGPNWRVGDTAYARFYVQDSDAPFGLAVSQLIRWQVFGDANNDSLLTDGFE